jgi:hypothetical protein
MRPRWIAATLVLAMLSGACAPQSPPGGAGQGQTGRSFYEGPKSAAGFFCRDLAPQQHGWIQRRWGCHDVVRPGD